MKLEAVYIYIYTNVYRSQQVPEKVQFSSLSGRYLSCLLSILTSIVSSAVGQLVDFQPSEPDTPAWLKVLSCAVSS